MSAPTSDDHAGPPAAALWWFAEGWKRSVLDPEAPRIATGMFQAARTSLQQDVNYNCYRIILAQMLKEKDHLKALVKESPKEIETKRINLELAANSSFIDQWIDEVLRYLTLKVTIVGGEPTPSTPVKDALQALMFFPTTYGKVCKALGSPYAIDFDSSTCTESASPNNPVKNEWYNLTLGSYEVIFSGGAPETFWPIEYEEDDQIKSAPEVDSNPEAAPAIVRCDESSTDESSSVSEILVEQTQWKRVIQNPESPRLAADMVQAARVVFQRDLNYNSYRASLAETLKKKRNLNLVFRRIKEQIAYFLAKEVHIQEKMNMIQEGLGAAATSFIDDWIDELLRYLAMRILIVGEPIPSMPVKDAWKALTLLPATYSKVCKAMGSPSVIDLYKNTANRAREELTPSRKRNMHLYNTTTESYGMLFKEVAPATFWPIEYQEESQIGSTCCGTAAPAVICVDDWDDTSTLTLS